MDAPKVSVLIPLYNRKHYIEQCVDSVLNQTFQDFELIIRDDGSTDESADFVAKRYAKQIAAGKIKFRRNEENLGEFPTDNRLLKEATGKYVMILHSDDVWLPHALEQMYTIAEKYKADVVHSQTRLLTDTDGIIEEGTKLKVEHNKQLNYTYNDTRADKIEIVPNDLELRFNEWLDGTTFIDAQYNIFNRKFLADNDIWFLEYGEGILSGNRLFTLNWILRAKVFVKTLDPFYIRRDSEDSLSNAKVPPERVTKFIDVTIKLSRNLEEYFAREEFFRDNKERQYLARSSFLTKFDQWRIKRNNVYKKGITPELNQAVEEAFKKHFGEDYAFLTFLFHWAHALQVKRSVEKLVPPEKTVPPPPKNEPVDLIELFDIKMD